MYSREAGITSMPPAQEHATRNLTFVEELLVQYTNELPEPVDCTFYALKFAEVLLSYGLPAEIIVVFPYQSLELYAAQHFLSDDYIRYVQNKKSSVDWYYHVCVRSENHIFDPFFKIPAYTQQQCTMEEYIKRLSPPSNQDAFTVVRFSPTTEQLSHELTDAFSRSVQVYFDSTTIHANLLLRLQNANIKYLEERVSNIEAVDNRVVAEKLATMKSIDEKYAGWAKRRKKERVIPW